jgi:hypothetical protein
MAGNRPPIPAQMRRDVLIESGYRCAIPNCRETEYDIHHIVDYAVVQLHTFDNLIVLCPNCHRRVTNGEIDQKAVKQIKANLSVLAHRYSEMERRYLQATAERGVGPGMFVPVPIGFELLMRNLVDDGLVTYQKKPVMTATYGAGMPPIETGLAIYALKQKGAEFINHWLRADPLG